jgi:hypothetical protein
MQKIFIVFSFFIFLSGCDQRPIIQNDNLEFSVGNVALGTEKIKAKELTDLSYCTQEKQNLVECFSTLKNHRIYFFGNPVKNITYKFFNNSSRVGSIDFSVEGQRIYSFSIEDKWISLKDRCISSLDAKNISTYSEDGRISIKQLSDWGIDFSPGDAACLSRDGQFISIDDPYYSEGQKSQRIKIFHLADIPSRFFNRALYVIAEKKEKDDALK